MQPSANRKTAVRAACLLLSFCLLLCACGRAPAAVSANGFAMGSLIAVNVYADKAAANAVTEQIFKEIAALDARISATDEKSEISALNRGETVELTPETYAFLRDTLGSLTVEI